MRDDKPACVRCPCGCAARIEHRKATRTPARRPRDTVGWLLAGVVVLCFVRMVALLW